MSDIRLELVDDWSTVKVGDPVRLTKDGTQINTLVSPESIADRSSVLAMGMPFQKSDGWVMERPVQPEPLPTVDGSIIRARLKGGRAALVKLSEGRWGSGAQSWSADGLWDELISWTWDTKPESLVVEETRNLILGDVLEVFDSSGITGTLEVDDLRNVVARAIAKAGSTS